MNAGRNGLPTIRNLTPELPSPQDAGAKVKWTARASDPDGDPLLFLFSIKGPSTNGDWKDVTSWSGDNTWTWSTSEADIGTSQISVKVRDGNHAGPKGADDERTERYSITAPPAATAPFTPEPQPTTTVSEQPPTQAPIQTPVPVEVPAQVVQQEAINQAPTDVRLSPNMPSPQEAGVQIVWTATAVDPDNDPILYRFVLRGTPVTDWTPSNTWTWTTTEVDSGSNQVEVQVRDGRHAGPQNYDANAVSQFVIAVPNQLPTITAFGPNAPSPQDAGAQVIWTARATDPENDPLLYRFMLRGTPVTDWTPSDTWTWTTSEADTGNNQIEVQVRDGKHAGPEAFDAQASAQIAIIAPNRVPTISALAPDVPSPQVAGTVVTWTATASDPENDPLLYRFLLRGTPIADWAPTNTWAWKTTEADVGDNQIEVQVRDGKHAGPEGSDANTTAQYIVTAPVVVVPPIENVTNVTSPETAVTEPAANVTAPAENITVPAENVTAPAENVTKPLENATQPTQNVTEPVENVTAPVNVTLPVENVTTNVTEPVTHAVVYSISGSKFKDQNANGAKDAGEPGLAQWTIRLAGQGGNGTTVITGPDGSYRFDGLAPGDYTVSEDTQQGWVQTAPTTETYVATIVDKNLTDLNFGNRALTFSISGVKFNDQNGNGVNDGEPGLSGWTITLTRPDGSESTTTTGSEGSYLFDNLTQGTYTVGEVQQEGWNQTFPSDGRYVISIGAANETGRDFGNRARTYTISGAKFNDQNANGKRDPDEPGLPEWTITLNRSDGKQATDITGPDGTYSFENLTPGSYVVSETPRAAWVQTMPAEGSYSVNLAGSDATGRDFGNRAGTYAISGIKFNDQNGNGAKDEGEPGLSGWTIRMVRPDATEVTAITGQDGSYKFENLQPGNYTLAEVDQQGWTQTAPVAGTYSVAVVDADVVDQNFGNIARTYAISGVKFNDLNGNGINEGEPGLVGWTIRMVGPDGSESTATTAIDGSYRFGNLTPGAYTLTEVAQENWVQTAPNGGSLSVTVKDGDVFNQSFGNRGSLAITGLKYNDRNANGVRDEGEPGLAGWAIRLEQNGSAINVTNTGSDGSYAFKNLVPGAYTVSEVMQEGWSQTAPTTGSYSINLASSDVTGQDFGNRGNLTISGLKYYDIDGNGVQDKDEPGIPGSNVSLVENNNVIAQTVTGEDGSYSFTGLMPGAYTINDPLPTGLVLTTSSSISVSLTSTTTVVTKANFGIRGIYTISGKKFNDLNDNEQIDTGEAGISNWGVVLDGSTFFGAPITITTYTAADGSYSFPFLIPGTYRISELSKPSWIQTAPKPDGFYTVTIPISGVPGNTVPNRNFGNRPSTPPTVASIWGAKYNDLNRDGVRDAGELGMQGWQLQLKNSTNVLIGTAVTAADGSYNFTNLSPGAYTLSEVAQPGWTQSQPPASAGGKHSFTLTAGESRINTNFGNYIVSGPPSNPTLVAAPTSPKPVGTMVTWTAGAASTNPLQFRFFLRGPLPATYTWVDSGWIPSPTWTWNTAGFAPGTYRVEVWIRDGLHSPGYDVTKTADYTLAQANQPPSVYVMYSDRPSPQLAGSWVRWNALASDPEGDPIFYRYWLRGPSTGGVWADQTGWTRNSAWIWRTSFMDSGPSEVMVLVRDGKHAPPNRWDDFDVADYFIVGYNQPPSITSLASSLPSPQQAGSLVRWAATASDPERDTIYYSYWLSGPSTGGTWRMARSWSPDNTWNWVTSLTDIGQSQVEVRVIDGYHSGPSGFDDAADAPFAVLPVNRPPVLTSLVPDRPAPQYTGTPITWTATATDPDRDQVLYRFWVRGPSTGGMWKIARDWSASSTWIWNPGPAEAGDYTVYVYARDGRHASAAGYDTALSAPYTLLPPLGVRKLTSGGALKDKPSLAYTGDGYLLGYQSWETGPVSGGDIRLQRFDPYWNSQAMFWATSNKAYQDMPSVIFAGGNYYVAYVSEESGNLDIYVSRYDGTLKLVETKKLTSTPADESSPSLIRVGNEFFLAYQSWQTGPLNGGDIFLTRFDQTWKPIKTTQVTNSRSYQDKPSVVFTNGSFYVAYASGETGNMDVFVRRLDGNLNPMEVMRITSDTRDQDFPSLSWTNGQFILLYATIVGDNYYVFLERFYRNWVPIEKQPVAAVSGPGDQTWPSLVYSTTDGLYWIAYASQDVEGQNIYTMPLRLAMPAGLKDCNVIFSFSATRANNPYTLTASFFNNYGELVDPLDLGISWSPQDAATVKGVGMTRVSKGIYQFSSKFGAAGEKSFRVVANIDGCFSFKAVTVNVA